MDAGLAGDRACFLHKALWVKQRELPGVGLPWMSLPLWRVAAPLGFFLMALMVYTPLFRVVPIKLYEESQAVEEAACLYPQVSFFFLSLI